MEFDPLHSQLISISPSFALLPQVYQLHTAQPSAYIEWYTPFGTPDLVSGLFTIKPSTHNNHIYKSILEEWEWDSPTPMIMGLATTDGTRLTTAIKPMKVRSLCDQVTLGDDTTAGVSAQGSNISGVPLGTPQYLVNKLGLEIQANSGYLRANGKITWD
ncbi:hypothetical protein B0H10DRAFT_1961824 [Mycena sp. CBHHK59/15]|nr:hypothetical protein B0H10DRAFT_1961824 [Mycena sp. CBHHK59/15]